MGRYHYVFPRWSNALLPTAGLLAAVVPLYATILVAYGFSPKTTDVGYEPEQPVPFSHRVHAGQLGMDCRYCHNTVEYADKAAIPPTQTCFNCHTQIHKESPNLAKLWESYRSGTAMEWVRVHDLPDYAYFSHAAHVTRGVSCVECHGRIDKMEVVYQHETLSMGWCLECHRHPETRVRDPELVTDLGWGFTRSEEERREDGLEWIDHNDLAPSQDCSTCHR
jgi:hypothetical protein